jgi:iron(III) transport system substrate-binding protein
MKAIHRGLPLFFLAILVALVLASLGCSSQPTVSQPLKGPHGTLSVYTSQPDSDIAKLAEAFRKTYPYVQVNIFRSGTEEVIARINTEVKAGKLGADVILLADAPTFEALKEKSLLLSYTSPQAQKIAPELIDTDGQYTPTKMIPTGIVVNTNKVKDLSKVDWSTLVDPASKGQVVMPSPLYSGAAAYNTGIFRNQSSLGWSYFEKLKTNDAVAVKGNGDVLKRVASGEKAYGIIVDFMVFRAKQQGSPVDFVYPNSGVTVITEPVAIVKTAQNLDAAKAFVDFTLSEEGQKLAVSLGYLPVRSDVTAPQGRPDAKTLRFLSTPTPKLAEQREQDKKDFSALFGG